MSDPRSSYDARHVSICLLNYNHAHLLESTLTSVMAQDCEGFEVIVSDDGSTDDSWTLIRELAARDPRVRAVCTARNLGMPGNANFAVEQSDRPYVALLHHDDLCRADLVRRWAMMLDRHPDVAFVWNAYGVHGSDFVYSHPFGEEAIPGRAFLRRHVFPSWHCPVRGTAMIRREAWLAVGGMRAEYGLLADIDLWMRLAARFDVSYVPEPLINVRQERPEDYPADYRYDGWSWPRQRTLYLVHAANRRALMRPGSWRDALGWLRFRARLSAETVKWLVYAVVRKRWSMLAQSPAGALPEELAPVGWLRGILLFLYRRRLAAKDGA